MAAVTRLGLYGGSRGLYGSFGGKTPGTPAPVVTTTKGRRKLKRYVVEIDGKHFEVSSIAAAESVLAQVRDIAQEAAEQTVTTTVTPKPPRVSIKTVTGNVTTSKVLQREVKRTQTTINKAFRRAAEILAKRGAVDNEISQLLQTKFRNEDDEDAIIALLM